MLGQIEYNINDFHPSLRAGFQAEIDRLNAQLPPFNGHTVQITVAKEKFLRAEDFCECGKCEDGFKEVTNFASAMFNSVNFSHEIFFHHKFFGVDADIAGLNKHLEDENDNHGGLSKKPEYVLTHEYGHCLMFMCQCKYGFEGKTERKDAIPTNKVQEQLINFHDKVTQAIDFSDDLSLARAFYRAMTGKFPPKEGAQPLVSNQAYAGPEEAWAETFTAVYYGDEKQKLLPSTEAMVELLAAIQADIFQSGRKHFH